MCVLSAKVGYFYLRAVLEPIWGGFDEVRETTLQAVREWFRGMIVMQEKGLMPPPAA